jgi:site-specific DNA recombinase
MTTTLDAPIRPHVASKPRAAIYSRVSTLSQEGGASLTTQKADCTRYAVANGLIVTHEYLDVQSGLESDRQQYQAMLRAAQAGEFDRIIVWKMDRFGRDRIESGFQLRALQQIGVKVDSATEPNDSPLLRNILMDFAEEESRRISLRVSANKKTRAQQGKRTTQPPFGYKNVPHPEGGVILAPNQDAPVVTECFKLYASGRYSLSDIRRYISEASDTEGRPQTRAGVHLMLKNRVYIGVNRHGFFAQSKIQIKTPAERLADVVVVEECHPSLIDKETFEKVQHRLESNRPQGSGRPRPVFLFTGLLWCACGSRYSGKRTGAGRQRITYYCQRRDNAGNCGNSSVGEARIREQVIGPIEKLLRQLNQEEVRAAVRSELMEIEKQEKAKSHAGKQGLGDELSRLEKRLTTWLEMVGDGEITREEYAKARAEVEPRIKELQAQLAARPHLALPDVEQFLALADALDIVDGAVTIAGEAVSDQWWRDVVEGSVAGIVVDGREIQVEWKPSFKGLLEMPDET